MDLQSLVNKFKVIAGVYAFDILPDGSYSEIRIMAINDISTMMLKVNPGAPDFYPGVPLRSYFTEINLENFMYKCAAYNEPLYSYVNAFGMWIKGIYLPLDEDGNLVNEKGEPNLSPRTAYCLYLTTRSDHAETDYMIQKSSDVASAVMQLGIKLVKMASFDKAMADGISELIEVCHSSNCELITVDNSKQSCRLYTENGEEPEGLEMLSKEMGRTPYEIAQAWEADLEGTDSLLLEDLSVIESRDPAWYKSMVNHGIKNVILSAIHYDQRLVGFIWSTNFDTNKTMEIKETLELMTFMLGAHIAHYNLVERLEELSKTDSLTQLLNRNALNNRIDDLSSGKKELPASMGVVYADLNGLKRVNDEGGHAAGDKLLTRAAALLKLAFGDYEIYRAGGDEFVAFCPDVTAEQLERQVAELKTLADSAQDVSFAIGTTIVTGKYDISRAMQEADEHMYQDKQEYYRLHPEMNWHKM